MRVLLKNILGTKGIWIPVRFLSRLSRQEVILPFYHAVSDEEMPHIKNLYRIKSIVQFRRDLDFLLKHFTPVSMIDLMNRETSRKHLSRPLMSVSFDDGLREVYEIISPILIEKGIPATFFINTSFLDNNDLFFKYKSSLIIDRLQKQGFPVNLLELIESRLGLEKSNKKSVKRAILEISYQNQHRLNEIGQLLDLDFQTFLKVRRPYMTGVQLEDLLKKGFQIGSHSMDHPLFSQLIEEDQVRQAEESINRLVKRFSLDYRLFAFPFTDVGVGNNFFTRAYSEDTGFMDMSFGTSGMKKEIYPRHLQRIEMESSRMGAGILIKGEYLYYFLKGLVGKNLIVRQ